MSEKTLRLSDTDELPFEQIYYNALSMADPERADKLSRRYPGGQENARYWRNAFHEGGYQDNALISTILNELSMPFGAYVVEREEENLIEIAPLLYSARFDRLEFMDALFSDEVTEEELRRQERTIRLTADFLKWIEQRERL